MFFKKNNTDFSEENRLCMSPSYMIIETLKTRSGSPKSDPLLSPPNDVIVCGHWSPYGKASLCEYLTNMLRIFCELHCSQ